MIRTVDVVIEGDGTLAQAAAVAALKRGHRILVVVRSGGALVARRLRRMLIGTAGTDSGQISVMTSAEVVCVDGVTGVEAVVIRHAATGRLSAVNASAFISCDGHQNEHYARRD